MVRVDTATPMTQEPGFETRRKLMNAAERLFADRGFAGVSVRDITDAANVNSALVGYHFRGKLGLLSAIYRQHAEALTTERLRLLSGFQAEGRRATLEEILEAFVRPALSVTCDDAGGADFLRLRSVLAAENSELLEQLVAENFDRSSGAFVDAFCSCLPDLTRDDVLWRFHFLLGAIYYTATGPHRIRSLSQGRCDPTDPEATLRQLIPFMTAGFRAGPINHASPGKSEARKGKLASRKRRI
jgi:AcrR family transcriptional regulator